MCSSVNDAQDRQSFYQERWKANTPCQAPSIWKLAGKCQLCEQSAAGNRSFGLQIIQGYKIWLWFELKCQNSPENKPLPSLQWNQSVVCCFHVLFLYGENKKISKLISCFKTKTDLYHTKNVKMGHVNFSKQISYFSFESSYDKNYSDS